MKIHVGTSGYGYREWKGKFYPEKIPPGEMLRFYSERLRAVEINNTFYQMPRESILSSWAEQVPDDFVFTFKAPRVITHLKRLKNVDEEVRHLFRTLSVLDSKLGPLLFQFPRSFHKDLTAFSEFLDLLPDLPCAFEFRHQSWIDNENIDLLRERRHGLCITDTDENPATEIIGTASWGYLRLRCSDYSDADLSEWIETILSQKWEKVFVFFKHEEEAKGPEMAMRFHEFADSRQEISG
jgi:uncharacterized protein YecE (DUF72 family)